MLPGFGWDDVNSYRARRDWATALAESGATVVRMDFPGTENSIGSLLKAGVVDSWIAACRTVAAWMRGTFCAHRSIAIGLGIGGLIATQAVAEGAAIDDLMLWAVRATGRAHARELRAYAAVVAGENGEDAGAAQESGVVSIGGFAVSPETLADLAKIDLTKVTLPDPQGRRVLLVGRDATGVDDRLREHMEASGVTLTVHEADDYYTMTRPPQYGLRPWATVTRSLGWVTNAVAPRHESPTSAETEPIPDAVLAIEFTLDGQAVRESIKEFDTPAGRISGIIAEPAAPVDGRPCLVTINAAVMRCTGPNRLNVDMTRAAAASGFPALRLDLPGIGDSDGTEVLPWQWRKRHNTNTLVALSSVFDTLQMDGVASSFVGLGLSLGAFTMVGSAMNDKRVVGVIGLNMNPIKWTGGHRRRIYRRLELGLDSGSTKIGRLRGKLPQPASRLVFLAWQRWCITRTSLTAKVDASGLRWILHLRDVLSAPRALNRIGATGAQIHLLYGEGEFSWEVMQLSGPARRLRRWPNIHVATLPSKDHILRPLRVQDLVRDYVATTLDSVSTATTRR
jgi:alpha/beta superfamily hydrolase